MSHAARQFIALILSICAFFAVVYQKPVSGQMDATGMLASMGGTILTGIGVSGLMQHTGPCVSEGVECEKMAMDVGMVAGGILAMLAGQSTADAATGTESSDLGNLGSGGGSDTGDLGNLNYDYGNYNYNYNTNGNTNPYVNTFCTQDENGTYTCDIGNNINTGLGTYTDGLNNGTMSPFDGMSAGETLDTAQSNLSKLSDALSKLQDKLNKDVDDTSNNGLLGDKSLGLGSLASLGSLNFGDDAFSSLGGNKSNNNSKNQNPVRINGLEAEDVSTGRKLTLFERATRRYNGTRDYNRAFTVAKMELLRKRAKAMAKKNSGDTNKTARSPASIKTSAKKSLTVKSTKD